MICMNKEFQVKVMTCSSSDHHVDLPSSQQPSPADTREPRHGSTNGSEFNLSDVVNFTCNPGYLLQGASQPSVQAMASGVSPLPTCRGRRSPGQWGQPRSGGLSTAWRASAPTFHVVE